MAPPTDRTESSTQFDVGKRLRELRLHRGLSQRELARRAAMTNANLSMIEQGRVSPSIQTLEKILRAMPISLSDFFGSELPSGACVTRRSAQPHILGDGLESFVCSYPVADGSPFHIILQYLKPGAALTEIPLIFEEGWVRGVVIQGSLTLTLGDQIWTLEEGDAFQFHPHRSFCLKNPVDQILTLVLVLNPRHRDIDNKV